jgi:hypothetical protein
MEAAVAEALRILLAADRLLESARPVGLAALTVLLALKAGPAYPHELAASLRSPPGRVRQRLLRLRKSAATRELVRVTPDGRYWLSRKGHRFVNGIGSLAYYAKPATDPSRA